VRRGQMRGTVKQLFADRRKRIMADKIIIYGTDT
jgi:hypothetical protein